MITEKIYPLFGYRIEKVEKGNYRIYKDGKYMARKRTLELAKNWVRDKVGNKK